MTGFLETQSQNPRFSGHQSRIQNYKPISEVIDFPDSLEIATGFLETQSTSKVKILCQNVIESQPKKIGQHFQKVTGFPETQSQFYNPSQKKSATNHTLVHPAKKKMATNHTLVHLAKKNRRPVIVILW